MTDTGKVDEKSPESLAHHQDAASPEQPPPYDGTGAPPPAKAAAESSSASTPPPPGTVAEPPTYQDASTTDQRDNLPIGDPPTFILQGYEIHAESQPGQAIYELGLNPMSARQGVCGLEKIWYSVGPNDGGLRARKRHIYDLTSYPSGLHMHGHVTIVGKSGPTRSHKQLELVGGSGWSSCKVEGHFKAQSGWGKRLIPRGNSSEGTNQVEWKNASGEVVAIEQYPLKPDEKDLSPEELPRLNVQAQLDNKELDALVACWVSRFWKIRQVQTKEPFSWGKGELNCSIVQLLSEVLPFADDCASQTTNCLKPDHWRGRLRVFQVQIALSSESVDKAATTVMVNDDSPYQAVDIRLSTGWLMSMNFITNYKVPIIRP